MRIKSWSSVSPGGVVGVGSSIRRYAIQIIARIELEKREINILLFYTNIRKKYFFIFSCSLLSLKFVDIFNNLDTLRTMYNKY